MNTSFSTRTKLAHQFLKEHFCIEGDVPFPCQFIESFSVAKNGKLHVKSITKTQRLLAIECLKHQHYYIVDQQGELFLWGEAPINFFFGFKESLVFSAMDLPNFSSTLVMSDDPMTVLSLNLVHIPSILVTPVTVWENFYFNSVVRSKYKNLIITFEKYKVPKAVQKQSAIHFLDLQIITGKYLKFPFTRQLQENGMDLLNPLFDLFESVSDEDLNIDDRCGEIKIFF